MEYEIVTLEEKKIAGVSARTRNDDPHMMQKVGALWQQLFTGAKEKLPGVIGETLYGLYTNYESDVHGAYDAVAGCEVHTLQNLPAPFTGVTIPAGKYAKFSFAGDSQKSTGLFWQAVWQTPLDRKYTCDFEMYPPCEDHENANIYIFVALCD